jgi:hypothetical protein
LTVNDVHATCCIYLTEQLQLRHHIIVINMPPLTVFQLFLLFVLLQRCWPSVTAVAALTWH